MCGNVLNRSCYFKAEEPGTYDNHYRWYIDVASGATQPFEVTMSAQNGMDMIARTDSGVTAPSEIHFDIQVDPFLWIDPEWEYADEYTLELSPGMYVGPPPNEQAMPHIPLLLLGD
jgi:hypothetical protein